uniref:Uncharacterized protein n=1 Tax=Glossina pallidipes TaxID=7398 RepID=A0A1A9ZCY5_GLOPL
MKRFPCCVNESQFFGQTQLQTYIHMLLNFIRLDCFRYPYYPYLLSTTIEFSLNLVLNGFASHGENIKRFSFIKLNNSFARRFLLSFLVSSEGTSSSSHLLDVHIRLQQTVTD